MSKKNLLLRLLGSQNHRATKSSLPTERLTLLASDDKIAIGAARKKNSMEPGPSPTNSTSSMSFFFVVPHAVLFHHFLLRFLLHYRPINQADAKFHHSNSSLQPAWFAPPVQPFCSSSWNISPSTLSLLSVRAFVFFLELKTTWHPLSLNFWSLNASLCSPGMQPKAFKSAGSCNQRMVSEPRYACCTIYILSKTVRSFSQCALPRCEVAS